MPIDTITSETMRPDLSEQRSAILGLMVALEGELERNERILTALNEVKRAGRWAAFTDDELDQIGNCMAYAGPDNSREPNTWRPIVIEIQAELERRAESTKETP